MIRYERRTHDRRAHDRGTPDRRHNTRREMTMPGFLLGLGLTYVILYLLWSLIA